MAVARSGVDVARFRDLGVMGPVTVLTVDECQRIVGQLEHLRPPAEWRKGRAITNRLLFDLATSPQLLDYLNALLGPDIILWGADIVTRQPGSAHSWHSDMETAEVEGRCVSVWIGLDGTEPRSGLKLIARSHRVGSSLQDAARQQGHSRGGAADDDVIAWAQRNVPSAALVRPHLPRNGAAVLFDGRVWHGSVNTSTSVRTALLLQYSDAGALIRIPRLETMGGPFEFLGPAPCLVVSGRPSGSNRIVEPPAAGG